MFNLYKKAPLGAFYTKQGSEWMYEKDQKVSGSLCCYWNDDEY